MNAPAPSTEVDQAFLLLSATYREATKLVKDLAGHVQGTQAQVAQHFQTTLMKELQIFRGLEAQLRNQTATADTIWEQLATLETLRSDSMKHMTVIMQDALTKIREGFDDSPA